MFNTPITGLSFIANVCIVIIGAIYNTIRRRPLSRAIISQKHILELENTKVGSWVTSVVAVLMPLFIFLATGALSGYGLYMLYADQSKVSIIDAAGYTVRTGEKGIGVVHNTLSNISGQSKNILDTNGTQTLTIGDNGFVRLVQNIASFANTSSITGKQGLFSSSPDGNNAVNDQFMGVNRLPSIFTIEKATTSLIHQELYANLPKGDGGYVLGAFWTSGKKGE